MIEIFQSARAKRRFAMELSVRDSARLLNVSEKTIYRWVKHGKLPAYRVNEQYRFNRAELLEEARTRIYQNPDTYVHHVFGETEAGGTSVLYISDVPFERLGFRGDVGATSYPALTQTALSAVPFVLTLWPPILMGLYAINQRREGVSRGATGESESHHE